MQVHHVAVEVHQPSDVFELMTFVKSVMKTTNNSSVFFHMLTNVESKATVKKLFDTWQLDRGSLQAIKTLLK